MAPIDPTPHTRASSPAAAAAAPLPKTPRPPQEATASDAPDQAGPHGKGRGPIKRLLGIGRAPTAPGVSGTARVDRKTKHLTARLQPGDIAVIDHEDLDRVAAETLVAARPAAVLNAAASTSGRFPNLGPQILVDAGIPLVDRLGPAVMLIGEGSTVRVEPDTGRVFTGRRQVAAGQVQTTATVADGMERAGAGLAREMSAFAENTMEFIRAEGGDFFDELDVRGIRTRLAGRPALIVVRGYSYKEDLSVLRPYVKEVHPVLIGVDGGADALLEAGLRPDMIIGDMDSVSDKALACGAELVVHAYRDGRAPGAQRVEALGLPYLSFPAAGTSEDVAMMIADDAGASLIVAVGSHLTMVEFLDKGRAGMASTFLTRLRVGGKLVDAKGVSRLYRRGVSNIQIGILVVAGLAALVAALGATNAGQTLLGLGWAWWDDLVAWVGGWL
ncbi:MAG: thiamine pyrophosphokinase [Bifidobacteriaceae bacterium]|jgi:uncharacterized membrane-anchored protein|nr:thiamine pyrophosphokinase [Bifidobacteriaceae bacterium]